MSITYPPEMLPRAEADDNAKVIVCGNSQCCLKAETERLRAALTDICDAWDSEDGRGGKYRGNITKAHAVARAILATP